MNWKAGDTALLDGELVTIERIDGLFADCRHPSGWLEREVQISGLKFAPYRADLKPRLEVMLTERVADLELERVEEMINRPIGQPVTVVEEQPDVQGTAVPVLSGAEGLACRFCGATERKRTKSPFGTDRERELHELACGQNPNRRGRKKGQKRTPPTKAVQPAIEDRPESQSPMGQLPPKGIYLWLGSNVGKGDPEYYMKLAPACIVVIEHLLKEIAELKDLLGEE